MNFISIIYSVMDLKKQTLIIIALSLIVAALAGLYVINNDEAIEVMTIEQPKPDSETLNKSDELRKGKFIKSDSVGW